MIWLKKLRIILYKKNISYMLEQEKNENVGICKTKFNIQIKMRESWNRNSFLSTENIADFEGINEKISSWVN